MFYGLKRRRLLGRTNLFKLSISIKRKNIKLYISDFKNGNEEAFSKIYNQFRLPILRYVNSKLADNEVSQELTQEIFIKVFRFRDSYQEQYAFSTWLWTIARNTVFDHLRGIKFNILSGGVPSESGFSPEEIASPNRHAEAILVRKSEIKNIIKMMRSLTRLQRRVLWMRVIRQLSYQEISKKLNLSLSSVKNLTYRAKIGLSASPVLLGCY